jgi:predicted ATPase
MDEKTSIAEVHRTIIERYPMYHEDPAFEAWLHGKAGTDVEKIEDYLDTLADYGYIDGEGMVCGDYTTMPDPSRILDDIRARLDRLGRDARELLRVASVEGPTFSLEVLSHLRGCPAENASRAIDDAVDAGIVRADGSEEMFASASGRYRFYPLQVREVLYEELAGGERAELHRRAVEFLTDELERNEEPGSREMIGQLIEEHNRHASRPAGSHG